MNPTKVFAFLLGLASLAGLLFFGFVAFAGPSTMGAPLPPQLKSLGLGPGCLGFILFCAALPIAAVPGLAGLGLWLFVIRKQEAAEDWEAMARPERETYFQDRLDHLTRRLLERGGDAASLAAEIPVWTRDLDGRQKNRLLCFLAGCGFDSLEAKVSPVPGDEATSKAPGWGTRALSLGLLGFAAFCFLWGVFVAFSYLTSDLGKIVGLEKGLTAAVAGSGGCFAVGLAALLGSLATRWLARRETKRSRRLATSLQRAREVILESCLRRMASLLEGDGASVVRIARAHVVCSLPELDGAGKGRLIGCLQSSGALSRLALSGADLRGAALAGTDLSATALAGVNLSGASLSGTHLVQADLHGSHLRGADLSKADAGGADLRDADLRQARLHHCNLRQADLRGANLEGANLWQADVTGAQLQGVRLTPKQLAGVLGGAAEPSNEKKGERL